MKISRRGRGRKELLGRRTLSKELQTLNKQGSGQISKESVRGERRKGRANPKVHQINTRQGEET